MPHPKASPRRNTKRGRKRRQCAVLTGSAETNKLFLEQKCSEERKKKNRKKANRPRARVNLLKRPKPTNRVKHSCLVCEEPYLEST